MDIRWGTIGCGDVVERKAGPALRDVEGSNLLAVMRRTREAAEDYAKRNNIPRFYDNINDLLADEEINCIYVATPNNTHLEPVLSAAEAGKHIIVEKPMARDTEACQHMINACNERDLTLAVAYYRRGYPTILKAKELIDAGKIGAVTTIRINDEFPLSHRLDLVHFFCGDAEKVWATNEKLAPGSHADEGAVLHVRTLSGAEGIMNIGWEEKLAPETVQIVCENGSIDIDDLKGASMTVTIGNESERITYPPLPATHWGLIQNWVAHFADGTPLACNGVEGRKSTVILDIVNELDPDGPEVPVDYS